jgi:polyisoprenoid-binding protein YceI
MYRMQRISVVLGLILVAVQPALATPVAIDAQHSTLTVAVYKQGLFAAFADNHVIDAPIASGSYDDTQKAITLTVDATQMRVLDPKSPANRRADVQSNMDGPQVLDVNTYRTIEFRSTAVTGADAAHLTVSGNLTLHGQTHPITFTAVRAATHFSGSATVNQSAFGITPIRIAGGAVTVKDAVTVTFRIVLGA